MSISEEDKKILEAFHALRVKPMIDKPEDLLSYIKHMGKELDKDPLGTGDVKDTTTTVKTEPSAMPKSSIMHHCPRI